MRILVVSNLYPPFTRGGYEAECAAVSEHLGRHHQVTVLTCRRQRGLAAGDEQNVRRQLPLLEYRFVHSLRAPAWTVQAASAMRRALAEVDPALVFIWNGAQLPQAALRIALDSGRPVAFRVCELWFGRMFTGDQFMRHLLPGDTGVRAVWARGMRAINLHPGLRLDPGRRVPAAISWNSDTVRRLAGVPPAVDPVFERIVHSTSPNAAAFAAVKRTPARDRVEIAFVGRVDAAKGAEVAARALRPLRERHGIDAVLRLVGPADQAVRARIDALRERVEVLGPLPPSGVAEVLAAAHALVVPSTVPDAFPLVCIEGALARVPIVASRTGGIPECVHDEVHALLIPPADPDALAAALARTLNEGLDTAERVARARARAEDFALPRYLEASERFVEDAVAALARGPASARAPGCAGPGPPTGATARWTA